MLCVHVVCGWVQQALSEEGKHSIGFFLAPWADNAENEHAVKEETKATIRCYPFAHNQPGCVDGKKCFYSGQPATHMALFARAF